MVGDERTCNSTSNEIDTIDTPISLRVFTLREPIYET
jgi:hypothetical protein